MAKRERTKWRVLVGMDYLGKRAEPGDIVDDLPEQSIPWLLEQDFIIPAGGDG